MSKTGKLGKTGGKLEKLTSKKMTVVSTKISRRHKNAAGHLNNNNLRALRMFQMFWMLSG